MGGAYIAEVAEAASGLNPWVEWARIEWAQASGEAYRAAPDRGEYAGSTICLARQEWPDLRGYDAPEVVHRLHKLHHAGLIVQSASADRVRALLEEYTARFYQDFYARMDAPARPTS